MSALPSPRPVSLDEFERMPHAPGVQELIDGVVVSVPPPKRRHKDICQAIFLALLQHFPTERARIEDGFLIGRHVLVPDVAITHPEQPVERGWSSGAPLVAIEVASGGNTPEELDRKTELYLSNGSEEVWVVYDSTKSLMMYTQAGESRFRSKVSSTALKLELDIAQWFK